MHGEDVLEGATWDSRAFSPALSYSEHAPITPSPSRIARDPDEIERMFVWARRE
jgi:hypothetical protein